MGTGCAKLIIDLFGCFLPSFSVHHSPLHLLTEELRERGVQRGGPKEHEMNKGENQLAKGWEKSAGRRRQAWNSDRLKVMGKDKKKEAWRDSGRILLLCSGVGKRPPKPGYYHSPAIRNGLQNTLDSMSSRRAKQPPMASYQHSKQGSGWERKRSHSSWPTWTEGALGWKLPVLSASTLLGLAHKMAWKSIYSGHKVKHLSGRKCCKHSCWATIGLNLN